MTEERSREEEEEEEARGQSAEAGSRDVLDEELELADRREQLQKSRPADGKVREKLHNNHVNMSCTRAEK